MSMRTKANASLVLLAVLFAAAVLCRYRFPGEWWTGLLLYAAEAGLVGALADLFAVTALFRHPFGWKWIPHTAIIPRNRDKLADGVVRMVEEQLLSKGLLMDKIRQYKLVEGAIRWADRQFGKREIGLQAWKLAVSAVGRVKPDRLSAQLDRSFREALLKADMSAYAGKGLKWLLQRSDFHLWLDRLVDYAAERAKGEETKAAIRKLLEGEKEKFVNEGGTFARWFKAVVVDLAEASDALNLEEAAETLHRNLLTFIEEMKDPEHELRRLAQDKLFELAEQLESSQDAAAAFQAWKNELLEQLSLQPSIEAMLGKIKQLFVNGEELTGAAAGQGALGAEDVKRWTMALAAAWWKHFKSDRETLDMLEGYAQQFVARILEAEHAVIGRIVRNTLEGFTEERLVRFVESKVDTDLQRIRLNGAVIGAAVGAGLYLLLHGIYAPLLAML